LNKTSILDVGCYELRKKFKHVSVLVMLHNTCDELSLMSLVYYYETILLAATKWVQQLNSGYLFDAWLLATTHCLMSAVKLIFDHGKLCSSSVWRLKFTKLSFNMTPYFDLHDRVWKYQITKQYLNWIVE